MNGKILIVDDAKDIAKLVQTVLSDAGFKTQHVADADSAFACLKTEPFDLMLLDVELGGISGLHLLEMVRKEPRTAHLPVILLTVLGSESQKVRGLGVGADDYVVKPFSGKELLARVQALLRRSRRAAQPEDILEAGGVAVDLNRQEVAVKGKRVRLTPMEFQLLAFLVKHKGYVLSYQTLSESLSEGMQVMTSETLYAHVKNLRKSLGDAGKMIETIHGIGYKFIEE